MLYIWWVGEYTGWCSWLADISPWEGRRVRDQKDLGDSGLLVPALSASRRKAFPSSQKCIPAADSLLIADTCRLKLEQGNEYMSLHEWVCECVCECVIATWVYSIVYTPAGVFTYPSYVQHIMGWVCLLCYHSNTPNNDIISFLTQWYFLTRIRSIQVL